jgi:hypothetical protein
MCINSRGLDEICPVEGKGLAVILPAKHGSQIGFGAILESSFMPVTIFWETSFFGLHVQVDNATVHNGVAR